MLLAEIRCRRKPRPAWSAALAAASSTVRFWKTLISGLSTTLQEISTAQKWDFIPKTNDLDEAKTALKTALQGLTTCRKTATELRKSFLDDRIAAAAIAEDTMTEKILKKLRHREAHSACFRKLSYALKPQGSKGGVTKVEVVIDGETVAYTEKKEVERETLNRNRQHFSQASGTPFTIFPLSEGGTTATKFKTSHLPDGTPVQMPADTFLETATILDLLKKPLPGASNSQICSRITIFPISSRRSKSGRKGLALPPQADTWATTNYWYKRPTTPILSQLFAKPRSRFSNSW
jgi:hypothetical protein